MRAGLAGATLGIGVAAALGVGVAVASLKSPPPSRLDGDRATCRDAGVSGRPLTGQIVSQGRISPDGHNLSISLASGHIATGVVVKAAPYSYVFHGFYAGPLTDRVYRLPPGASAIGNWFLCGS